MAVRTVSGVLVAVVVATGSAAFAQQPPVLVLDTDSTESPTHEAASSALSEVARRRGTVVVDLSPAPEAEPEAPGLLERAIEAYHAFDYDRAIELLDTAIAGAETSGGAGLDSVQLSNLHLFRALSHTQKSETAEAWSDLVRAAAIDPSRTLDSMQFPPRVIDAFGRAVASVRGDGVVAVEIVVPKLCRAWIDARAVELREKVSVARGEHYVRIDCKGYEAYGARRLISADATLEPALTARPKPSLERAIEEARSRGAATVLWVRETSSKTGTTLTMKLADVDTANIRASTIARADSHRLARAADGLVGNVVDSKPEIKIVEPIRPQPKPWYKRPWVWGVVGGAAVATAVLLPFVLDSSQADSFGIGLGGDAP